MIIFLKTVEDFSSGFPCFDNACLALQVLEQYMNSLRIVWKMDEDEIEDGAQIQYSDEEEFVIGDAIHNGTGTNASLRSDDEMNMHVPRSFEARAEIWS